MKLSNMYYRWRSTLVVLGVAAVLIGNKGFRRLVRAALEIRALQKEYSSLLKEETALQGELNRVHTSDFAIEAAARRDLGYVKPGELEYRFPPPTKQK